MIVGDGVGDAEAVAVGVGVNVVVWVHVGTGGPFIVTPIGLISFMYVVTVFVPTNVNDLNVLSTVVPFVSA